MEAEIYFISSSLFANIEMSAEKADPDQEENQCIHFHESFVLHCLGTRNLYKLWQKFLKHFHESFVLHCLGTRNLYKLWQKFWKNFHESIIYHDWTDIFPRKTITASIHSTILIVTKATVNRGQWLYFWKYKASS